MVTVYHAQSILDAHLVKGLLENEGVPARVAGGELQGGIGELPVFGLIRVMVADEQAATAAAIIDRWENTDPDLENGGDSGQNAPGSKS